MLIIAFVLFNMNTRAYSEVILPDCLTEIEDQAFQGDVCIKNVVIPEAVARIGQQAYVNTELNTITIPSFVVGIASDASENAQSPLLIIAQPQSYAVAYTLHNNLDFDAGTVRRALIVGQTDYPAAYRIDGAREDVEKVRKILDGYVYSFTREKVAETASASGARQIVQVYPENCHWLGFYRPRSGSIVTP